MLRLEEKASLRRFLHFLEGSKHIKPRDKAIFARQFATMISSGLAVLRALTSLRSNSEHAPCDMCGWFVQDVEAGCSVSTQWRNNLPLSTACMYRWLGRARLAAPWMRPLTDLRPNWRRTTASDVDPLGHGVPCLIAVFAIMVMIGMLLFVIPIFANMYKDLGGKLPTLTRLMIGLSNALKDIGSSYSQFIFLFV